MSPPKSEPVKTPWKISVAAEIQAYSASDALTQIQRCVERLGGKFVGGGATPKREASDE